MSEGKKGVVYITQETHLDVSPAAHYGTLAFLASRRFNIMDPRTLVEDLRQKLVNYSDEDYLLCVGNPSVIGVACSVAAEVNNGRYNLLVWDRIDRIYYAIRVDLEKGDD